MLLPFRMSYLARFASTYTADIILGSENRARCLKCMHAQPPLGLRPNKMVPNSKFAAVLVTVCVDDDGAMSILYTRRSPLLSRHTRQISFPGGLKDEGDTGYEDCALRETEEEIGLPRSRVEIWGSGPIINPPHTANIMPVYGIVRNLKIEDLVLNKMEVDEAFKISLEKLAAPKAFHYTQYKDGYSAPVFLVNSYRVWGITAFITHNFLFCLLPDRIKPKVKFIRPYKTKKVKK